MTSAWKLCAQRSPWRLAPWRAPVGAWLAGLSRGEATAIAGVAAAGVASADLLAGTGMGVGFLYLGPIGFAAWFGSARAAVVLSLASAGASAIARLANLAWSTEATWNMALQVGTSLVMAALVASARSRLQSEQLLARTDALTHIPNRRAFLEQSGVELQRARRTRRPITIAYLDCDDFKVVNDRMGHAQGDALLVAVAATLRSATRAIDTVARLGGDEFGLLLVDTDGPASRALLERLRSAIVSALLEHGWVVTFSVGAVTFVVPPRSVDEMVIRADELMFMAKRSGKDAIRHEILGRPTLVASGSGQAPYPLRTRDQPASGCAAASPNRAGSAPK
jgi:diguanylate cyclase (GGDEF)-like protein